jgi:hypothetical protein
VVVVKAEVTTDVVVALIVVVVSRQALIRIKTTLKTVRVANLKAIPVHVRITVPSNLVDAVQVVAYLRRIKSS